MPPRLPTRLPTRHLHSFFKPQTRAMSGAHPAPIWSAGASDPTKEDALRLLHAGNWTLSATQLGLERKFEFKTFKTTMLFINQIADECKRKKHHPEWANVYNKVVIRWTTHSPLGLSGKDVEMAQFCDAKGAELGDLGGGAVRPVEETGEVGGNVLDELLGQGVQECGPCTKS